jgi:hypothetical protein
MEVVALQLSLTLSLSQFRCFLAATSLLEILFSFDSLEAVSSGPFNVVDVFDVTSNTW